MRSPLKDSATTASIVVNSSGNVGSRPLTTLRTSSEWRLGEGGMATVYLAEDLKHERKVALAVRKREEDR